VAAATKECSFPPNPGETPETKNQNPAAAIQIKNKIPGMFLTKSERSFTRSGSFRGGSFFERVGDAHVFRAPNIVTRFHKNNIRLHDRSLPYPSSSVVAAVQTEKLDNGDKRSSKQKAPTRRFGELTQWG